MQSPTRKRKEKRTMDARGSVSATTSASIRKDVPLRLSISLFDDRAPKVLQLRQTSLAYTFLQICLRASDSPVSRSIVVHHITHVLIRYSIFRSRIMLIPVGLKTTPCDRVNERNFNDKIVGHKRKKYGRIILSTYYFYLNKKIKIFTRVCERIELNKRLIEELFRIKILLHISYYFQI